MAKIVKLTDKEFELFKLMIDAAKADYDKSGNEDDNPLKPFGKQVNDLFKLLCQNKLNVG
jgi:hypothetical protein